jgi:RNA recognition motif-containing protein
MAHQGYGFCEFLTEEDAEYACKIMNQIKLWGKPIRVNKVIGDLVLSYSCFTMLNIVVVAGILGQETARCRRQPLYWQS